MNVPPFNPDPMEADMMGDPFAEIMEPDEVAQPVKLKDSEYAELGVKLVGMIEAGIQQQGSLPERWEANEKDYSNQPRATGVELVPGQAPRHINITQPRIDQLVANVAGPLTSHEPYFTAQGYNQPEDTLNVVEDTVHFLLRVAQFERHLRVATRIACMAEPAIVRVMIEEKEDEAYDADTDITFGEMNGKMLVPRIDVIHPKNFVFYNTALADIRRAPLVGHRFYLTVADIKDMIEAGAYLDYEDIQPVNENPQDKEVGRRRDWSMTEETAGISNPDDFPVQCFDVIFKDKLGSDKTRRYYRAVVAFAQKRILLLEEYNYSRPWYFAHFLHEEYEAFYRANPVAQNLQQLQQAFNEAVNMLHDASMFGAFPAGFTNNRIIGQEYVKYQAGTVYQVDGNPQIYWAECKFNPGALVPLMEKYESLADGAIRVSQAGMGQEFKSDMTATEASGIMAGQQAGLDEYRANAAMSGQEICDFLRELAFEHFNALSSTFANAWPCQDKSALQTPCRWEANGKTAENLPQTLVQKVQALTQFIAPFAQELAMEGHPVNLYELVKVAIGAMKLPVPTEKILPEQGGMNVNPGGGSPVLPEQGMAPNQSGPLGAPAGVIPQSNNINFPPQH